MQTASRGSLFGACLAAGVFVVALVVLSDSEQDPFRGVSRGAGSPPAERTQPPRPQARGVGPGPLDAPANREAPGVRPDPTAREVVFHLRRDPLLRGTTGTLLVENGEARVLDPIAFAAGQDSRRAYLEPATYRVLGFVGDGVGPLRALARPGEFTPSVGEVHVELSDLQPPSITVLGPGGARVGGARLEVLRGVSSEKVRRFAAIEPRLAELARAGRVAERHVADERGSARLGPVTEPVLVRVQADGHEPGHLAVRPGGREYVVRLQAAIELTLSLTGRPCDAADEVLLFDPARGASFIAEESAEPGSELTVTVPPGSYEVIVRNRGGMGHGVEFGRWSPVVGPGQPTHLELEIDCESKLGGSATLVVEFAEAPERLSSFVARLERLGSEAPGPQPTLSRVRDALPRWEEDGSGRRFRRHLPKIEPGRYRFHLQPLDVVHDFEVRPAEHAVEEVSVAGFKQIDVGLPPGTELPGDPTQGGLLQVRWRYVASDSDWVSHALRPPDRLVLDVAPRVVEVRAATSSSEEASELVDASTLQARYVVDLDVGSTRNLDRVEVSLVNEQGQPVAYGLATWGRLAYRIRGAAIWRFRKSFPALQGGGADLSRCSVYLEPDAEYEFALTGPEGGHRLLASAVAAPGAGETLWLRLDVE